MTPIRASSLLLVLAAVSGCGAPPPGGIQPNAAAERGSRLGDSLLSLMTLEEKIGQLVMAPADWGQTGPRAPGGGDDQVRQGRIRSFLNYWGAATTLRLQRVAVEQSRLHIPLLFAHDVIRGWRTIFPVPLAEDLGSIAVIGPLADDRRGALGSWAGAGRPEDAIPLLEGVRRAIPGARVTHLRGAPVDTADTRGFADAERAAQPRHHRAAGIAGRTGASGDPGGARGRSGQARRRHPDE